MSKPETTITPDQVSAAFHVLEPMLEAIEFMHEAQVRQLVRDMLEAAHGKG